MAFSPSGKALITASKDCLLKVWDLATQHCVETCVVHHAEITSMAVSLDGQYIFTAGADKALRLFAFDEEAVAKAIDANSSGNISPVLTLKETITRVNSERAISLEFDPKGRYLACLGSDRALEIWKFKISTEPVEEGKKPRSSLKQVRHTRLASKTSSVVFNPSWKISSQDSIKLLVAFNDNQLCELQIGLDSSSEVQTVRSIEAVGHRTEPKVVALSPSATLVASAAKDIIKVWNPLSGAMLRTVEVSAGVTFIIFLEESALVAGDEEGQLHLVDLTSGGVIDSSKAHDGAIRCATLRPDRKGMITGGADKMVKFWEFKSAKNAIGKKMKLIKAWQLGDEITALKYSPDARHVAVALLDLTVKVFFEDKQRLYHSFYGHKLPITALPYLD